MEHKCWCLQYSIVVIINKSSDAPLACFLRDKLLQSKAKQFHNLPNKCLMYLLYIVCCIDFAPSCSHKGCPYMPYTLQNSDYNFYLILYGDPNPLP